MAGSHGVAVGALLAEDDPFVCDEHMDEDCVVVHDENPGLY